MALAELPSENGNQQIMAHEELSPEFLIWLHGYQPTRKLQVQGEMIYDISLEHQFPGGINEVIKRQSYDALIASQIPQEGVPLEHTGRIFQSGFVGGHMYGSLRSWLKVHHPEDWPKFREVLRNQPIPMVDTFTQVIPPLVPPELQRVMMEIGIQAYEQDYGVSLRDQNKRALGSFGIWPAELAVSDESLDIHAQAGASIVILGQRQLVSPELATTYRYITQSGLPLVIIPYDNDTTNIIAGDQMQNAWDLVQRFEQLSIQLASVDWETIEHHHPKMIYWLNYLVNVAIPTELNKHYLQLKGRSLNPTVQVQIRESAWSCSHGYGRWTGENGCDCDGATPEIRADKQYLLQGLTRHNNQTIHEMNHNLPHWEEDFTAWFLQHRDSIATGGNITFEDLPRLQTEFFKRLLLGFIGMTSCGWYFGSSSSLERQIPANCLTYLDSLEESREKIQ